MSHLALSVTSQLIFSLATRKRREHAILLVVKVKISEGRG
jgi:hypothetical protein